MNYNDPRKAIRYIARDMEVSEFRHVMHEYFFIQNEKRPIFITGLEGQDHNAKLLNKLKQPLLSNMLCLFLDEKKICTDQTVNSIYLSTWF